MLCRKFQADKKQRERKRKREKANCNGDRNDEWRRRREDTRLALFLALPSAGERLPLLYSYVALTIATPRCPSPRWRSNVNRRETLRRQCRQRRAQALRFAYRRVIHFFASRFTPYRLLFINGEQRFAYAYTHHYASTRIKSAIATRRHRRHARARVSRGNRALPVAHQDAPRVQHRQGHRGGIEPQDRVDLSRRERSRFTSTEDKRDREMPKKPAESFPLR